MYLCINPFFILFYGSARFGLFLFTAYSTKLSDFTNWAWYRPGIGKYRPEDIDPSICTHVVYGFAVLDSNNLVIKPHDSWADLDNEFYKKVTSLKRYGIKVTIAIGGWNDSLGGKFSRLVNDPAARAKFVKHVVEFVESHGFDGLGNYKFCIFYITIYFRVLIKSVNIFQLQFH